MNKSLKEKITDFETQFPKSLSQEQVIEKLLNYKSPIPSLLKEELKEDDLVLGCQSKLYLSARKESDGSLVFKTFSDALISSALANLLTSIFSYEKPETILKANIDFLVENKILTSVSQNRSNGISSLFLRMQQLSLKFLI